MISFANPAFLYLGFLLAVPVMIHLMKHQIAVNLVFPSISFILKGRLPNKGRRKLRDILLLLLRMLIYTAVILMLADPTYTPKSSIVNMNKKQIAIILDNSSSMSGWNAISDAKNKLTEILEKENSTAEYMLISSSNKTKIETNWTKNKSQIIEKFNSIPITYAAGKHQQSLQTAIDNFSTQSNKKILVFSDFQVSDWNFNPTINFPPDIEFEFVACGNFSAGNVGILNAEYQWIDAEKLNIIVEIRNYSAFPERRTVSLEYAGKKYERVAEIPPSKTINSIFALKDFGEETAQIQLNQDAYTRDDEFFLFIAKPAPERIFAFAPLTKEPERKNDILFLQKAFSNSKLSKKKYDFFSFDGSNFKNMDLKDVFTIFVCGNCPYFDDEDYNIFQDFISKGGIIVVLPGRAASSTFTILNQKKILSAEYQGMTDASSKYDFPQISQIEKNHFLSKIFEEEKNSDIFLFPIYRYVKISPRPPAKTIIETTDNYPFLVSHPIEEGMLYAFTSAFDLAWNEFPISSSFLPILYEIASSANAAKRTTYVKKMLYGEALSEDIAALLAQSNQLSEERYPQPGIYKFEDKIPLQINVPRSESIPERQALSTLAARLSKKKQLGLDIPSVIGNKPDVNQNAINLWHFFAILALVALISESFCSYVLDEQKK